jgi:hypothetical protein
MQIGARRQIWHGAEVTEPPATNKGFAVLKPNIMRQKKSRYAGVCNCDFESTALIQMCISCKRWDQSRLDDALQEHLVPYQKSDTSVAFTGQPFAIRRIATPFWNM